MRKQLMLVVSFLLLSVGHGFADTCASNKNALVWWYAGCDPDYACSPEVEARVTWGPCSVEPRGCVGLECSS
jgi:hypothetical protein